MREELDEVEEVRSCLSEAIDKGATIEDIARAMHTFVTVCYTRQLDMSAKTRETVKKLYDALYGPEGDPEEGLLHLRRQLCRLARIGLGLLTALGAAVIWLLQQVLSQLIQIAH